MKKYLNLFDFKQKVDYKIEVLSGLTVAMALVPEAVAFAIIAGLSPLTGLYAAFVMGLVTSVLGGRPGMISGATGAVAIVIVTLAISHGPEYVFATVILAGIIQLLAGVLKLGKLMRLVPHPVIFGFVNGLAIIIFISQLEQFKDSQGAWLTGSSLYVLLALVFLTMLIIWSLPKLTKVFPASLIAILTIFAIVYFFGIDTKTVGDMASVQGGFPPFHLPSVPLNLETLSLIFPYALIVAGVGLIESLLTLNIIDEITGTRGSGNKEAVAQGFANVLSGMFLNSDTRIQDLYKRAYEKIAKSNNTNAIQNLVDDIIAKGIQFKQFNFDKTAINLLQQMVNFQKDSEVSNRNKHIQIIRTGMTQLVK